MSDTATPPFSTSAALPARPAATSLPDYGFGAPSTTGAVCNLFLAGAAGATLWLGAELQFWPAAPGHIPFAAIGLGCFVAFTAAGSYLLWFNRAGKLAARERLLNKLEWWGDEVVLDVGCGRGLFLVAAARRLARGGRGRAHGIDVWPAQDTGGTGRDAVLENARIEGVSDRVEVHTADMRHIPFPDATFDAVVSNAAIHNLYDRFDRKNAIDEIARVLKPGGTALISDTRHHGEYAKAFRAAGFGDVRRASPAPVQWVWAVLTCGTYRPAALLARKPG